MPVDSIMARGCICCVKYMLFLFNLLFWVMSHTHKVHTTSDVDICEISKTIINKSAGSVWVSCVCFSWAGVDCWVLACGCWCLRAASPPCRPPSRRSPPPTSSSPSARSSWWRGSWVAWVPSRRTSACCWVWVYYNTHHAPLLGAFKYQF